MSINVCNNNSMSAITSLPSGVGGGSLVLISTQTASSSSTISFTSGIDSTYKEYIFKFINMHPATDQVGFEFNMSVDGGSNYNVTKTSTFFISYHNEADNASGLVYNGSVDNDLAQSTDFQHLIFPTLSHDNDSNVSGTLHLFDPSNTTFVKHFICVNNATVEEQGATAPYTENFYVAGYGNTTSAIDAIQFKMSSGNMDSGTIKLYGVS
tara:strand:- start:12 stop:641 length:630 start_codon:yes stop_codon:yes gene_type:complete